MRKKKRNAVPDTRGGLGTPAPPSPRNFRVSMMNAQPEADPGTWRGRLKTGSTKSNPASATTAMYPMNASEKQNMFLGKPHGSTFPYLLTFTPVFKDAF